MAKSLTRESVFSVLASQELGFSFGIPQRVSETALSVVLPILRQTSLKRQYITFPETDKVLVFDTGSIDRMEAQNNTDENVFVRSGTIFRGKTQERALQRSAVLFPGKKHDLDVRCIHASRGIAPGSSVKYGGLTPHSFDTANYSSGYKFKDQHTTWANVQTSNMMMRCMARASGGASSSAAHVPLSSHHHGPEMVGYDGPTVNLWAEMQDMAAHEPKHDDLASNLDAFAKTFDDVLAKVKLVDDQAGLALITDRGVETVEVFDAHQSWKALHESAVKRLGADLARKDDSSVFQYKPEAAIAAVTKVLGMDFKTNRIFEHRPNNGEPSVGITGLTAGEYVGEIVELDGKLIHLVLLKKAG